jgi:hypothetical protein
MTEEGEFRSWEANCILSMYRGSNENSKTILLADHHGGRYGSSVRIICMLQGLIGKKSMVYPEHMNLVEGRAQNTTLPLAGF